MTAPTPDGARRGVTLNTQIVEMALVAAAFAGAGILRMWIQVRSFDRTYGHTDDRPPGE